MYLQAIEVCTAAGLRQYEISNFAKAGEECRHNLKYWNRAPYYGFGLGSHSFETGKRYANSRDLDEYVSRQGDAISFWEELTEVEEREERIFLALRQVRGLGYAELLELCGTEGSRWMERGIGEGWLERRGERVGFTSSGFLLSNDYISQLF
jgi:oxygen-independent coproporphyrinogen-3 oxidase